MPAHPFSSSASTLSPTQRALLDRLSDVRGPAGLKLETPVEKRAALALAQVCMVSLNDERTQAAISPDGRGWLRQTRAAELRAQNTATVRRPRMH